MQLLKNLVEEQSSQKETTRIVHNLVVFCFHLGHEMFKSGDYPVNIKVAESREPLLYKRESSFLPLFFYLFPFAKDPVAFSNGIFSAQIGVQMHKVNRGDILGIVNTTEPITSASCDAIIRRLVETYPFCRTELLTTTAFQRPIRTLVIGNGARKVIYSAAHHANEWITCLVLLRYAEELAKAIVTDGEVFGVPASRIREAATIYMVPMVDPDGVDLVTGAIAEGENQYRLAQRISADYPEIPFPDGWKANLLGTDLNLNYPAGWLMAREIKFLQGFIRPAPRDYVGRAPLNQVESRALAGYTRYIDPEMVLAYHAQGKEIYWQFQNYEIPGAEELGRLFAQASGYTLAETPYASSFAGYKDWFIQEFRRPGYTIEVGMGENPLPLEQFDEIYKDNVGILTIAALGGVEQKS